MNRFAMVWIAIIGMICAIAGAALSWSSSFDRPIAYVFIFQKAIGHPYSGNSESYRPCERVVMASKEPVYNLETLNEFKKKKKDGLQYIVEWNESSDALYLVQDVSMIYGDHYINVEGILWAKDEATCERFKTKVENLATKYAIGLNRKAK